MISILMTIIIYFTIGAIVWLTEDIRCVAGWRELLLWPSVVVDWIDLVVERVQKWLDDWSG